MTNIWLVNHAGTEVYIRDLSIALLDRGISVEVYSPQLGPLAEEIRKAGINVASHPDQLLLTPDIIHGHHFIPTLQALECFSSTPAIYFVHDRTHQLDTPPKHSRIMKYLATDHNTLERLVLDEAIPVEHTAVHFNWVDTKKFALRSIINPRPAKALMFSNHASDENFLPAVRLACKKSGISLDYIGKAMGKEETKPERVLAAYDIVFGKAKAAMEAMATGATVIPCDFRGLGEIVTTTNYRHYRNYNFGMKILNRPIETTLLMEEIKKYDPRQAGEVAALIRKEADFTAYVDRMLVVYQEAIAKHQRGETIFPSTELGPIQAFENDRTIIVNQVGEEEKSVNQVLTARLSWQKKHIQAQEEKIKNLEKNIHQLNATLVQKTIRWVKRKIGTE